MGAAGKTKNFIKSVSRRPVDASGLPSVAEFYTGKLLMHICCDYRLSLRKTVQVTYNTKKKGSLMPLNSRSHSRYEFTNDNRHCDCIRIVLDNSGHVSASCARDHSQYADKLFGPDNDSDRHLSGGWHGCAHIGFGAESNRILRHNLPYQLHHLCLSVFLVHKCAIYFHFLRVRVLNLKFQFYSIHLYSLCIDYAEGESNFIKRVAGAQAFNPQTPPICCCMKFLPVSPINK